MEGMDAEAWPQKALSLHECLYSLSLLHSCTLESVPLAALNRTYAMEYDPFRQRISSFLVMHWPFNYFRARLHPELQKSRLLSLGKRPRCTLGAMKHCGGHMPQAQGSL